MPRLHSLLVLMAILGLAACGFEPLYGTRADGGPVSNELAAIRIAPIRDRSGQILRNYLLDTLTPEGAVVDSRYTLNVVLIEPRSELGLRRDDTPTRINYGVTARFELVDRGGRRLVSGVAGSDTSYEITNSEYATLSNRVAARDRLLQVISEDIKQQLAAYFHGRGSRAGG